MRIFCGPQNGVLFLIFLAVTAFVAFADSSLAQVHTEMRMFSDSFISPEFEATQKSNYQFVGARLRTESFSEENLKMDIAGGVAVGEPLLNYLNFSEIFIESSQNQNETFYFGRKKMQWSELDSRWDLGIWEPVFKWNPLSAERQGLTGIFWQVERPYFTLALFASPIYLPNQGPNFDIENGRFVKGNPWFRRPPETIRIWDEATEIEYKLQKPDEAQVVLQNSFGIRIAFGETKNLRGQLSYTYKPVNQLAMGYDGNLDIAQLKGIVNIHPQVFYHSLAGADLSYKTGDIRAGLSGLYDHTNNDYVFEEKNLTRSVFADSLLVSPFIEWFQGSWGLAFQHLDMIGGGTKEEGELASSTREPLMIKYPFQQADQITLMSNLFKRHKLNTKISYLHSQKNNFDLVRFSSRFDLSTLWSIVAEMQLLKAGSSTIDNQNEIAQFANNDRFMMGVTYVF